MKEKIIEIEVVSPLLLLLVNFFADSTLFCIAFAIFTFTLALDENVSNSIYITTCLLFAFVIVGRLLVLPLTYNLFEKSSKLPLAKQFIDLLKHSYKAKIITLLVVFLLIPPALLFNFNDLWAFFLFKLAFGLLGSYIVLFIYWWIEDKIKARKQKSIE